MQAGSGHPGRLVSAPSGRDTGDIMTIGIERAACVGGGVIGSGWAARFVLNGIDVSIYDPDPEDRTQGGRGARQRRARVRAPVRRRTSGPRGAPGSPRASPTRSTAPGSSRRACPSGSASSAPSLPRSLPRRSPTPSSRRPPPGSCRATCSATSRTPSACWPGTRSIPSTCSLSSRWSAGGPRLLSRSSERTRCTHPSA